MNWLKPPAPRVDPELKRQVDESVRESRIAVDELLHSLRQRKLCRIAWEFGSCPPSTMLKEQST
jgi:hypothetical protein